MNSFIASLKVQIFEECVYIFENNLNQIESLSQIERKFWSLVWKMAILCKDFEQELMLVYC